MIIIEVGDEPTLQATLRGLRREWWRASGEPVPDLTVRWVAPAMAVPGPATAAAPESADEAE